MYERVVAKVSRSVIYLKGGFQFAINLRFNRDIDELCRVDTVRVKLKMQLECFSLVFNISIPFELPIEISSQRISCMQIHLPMHGQYLVVHFFLISYCDKTFELYTVMSETLCKL